MKTTILFAVLLSVGFFFQNKIQQVNLDFDFSQKKNFVSSAASSTLDLYPNQRLELTKENITKQSSSFISKFLKVTILPIGTIVFLMWLIFGLDIFRSIKNQN
ncbi:MAG: hypothetical protein ACJAT4_002922 [Granulosicoccus sp.]|jgi:hypothetical protein